MGLSRRTFTKEFKLAAVQRLEQGVSTGEVARALEVNPNVLHRWRREFRQGPGNAFPGNGQRRWSEGQVAELERKIGQQTLGALRMALSRRSIEPGLVHHSDRGTQYASGDYTDPLKDYGITMSMSRKGNPWDNAACDSFVKTLKYEEVHRNEYRDLSEARASIREFLKKIYNQKRLHSALGYLPPAEFEAQHNKDAASRQLSL
jgi:transposase-like protein